MKRISLRLTLLSLAAAMLLTDLPSFTYGATAQLESPKQSSAPRRPAVRRRAARPAAVVPLGTNLRVRLNDDLSSKDSRVGDRFTATVVNPSRYDGATVRGRSEE